MFANNLRKARELSGLTQAALAERLGISRDRIAAWETRRSEPSIEMLLRLVENLSLSTDDLLGVPQRKLLHQLPRPAADLAEDLFHLHSDQLAIVHKLVRAIASENE